MRLRTEGMRPAGRAFIGRWLGVALATAGLLGLSLTSAVVASSANAAVATFGIDNAEHEGYCLTSGGHSDTTATVYSCNGSSNQTWHYGQTRAVGSELYREIVNGDGQCLGIAGGSKSAGAHAVVWNCNGHEDQYWLPEQNYGTMDAFDYDNLSSNMVIQIACDCNKNSATVEQWPYNTLGDPNQFWFHLT